MPLDGLTLGAALAELRGLLAGAKLDKITQPEEETVVLAFARQKRRLLLSARADAPRLQFTENAFSNPETPYSFLMNLRKALRGAVLEGIEQPGSERVAKLTFSAQNDFLEHTRVFIYAEFMGRHSNIILVNEQGLIVDACKRIPGNLSRVRQILPGLPYALPPSQGKWEVLEQEGRDTIQNWLRSAAPDFAQLQQKIQGLSRQGAAEVYELLQKHGVTEGFNLYFDRFIRQDFSPVLVQREGPADFLPFPYETTIGETRPMPLYEAMDLYYTHHLGRASFLAKQQACLQKVNRFTEKAEKKLAALLDAQNEYAGAEEYRQYGELLTANLHRFSKRVPSVTVDNYYNEQRPLEIPLDERLTPQENARRYFKRFSKLKTAAKLAEEGIPPLREELAYLEEARFNLQQAETLPDLAQWEEEMTSAGYLSPEKKKKALSSSVCWRYVAGDGTEILAGKNNLQNERLTFTALPDELWLHAKNQPGAHVLVKTLNPSPEALSLALQAACYHSRSKGAKTEVDATLRRNVKKIPGAQAGRVTYKDFRSYSVQADIAVLETHRKDR